MGKAVTDQEFIYFLADWANHLSWKQTAVRFHTSWEIVYRSVRHIVEWGREWMNLSNITAIGVDEINWKKAPSSSRSGEPNILQILRNKQMKRGFPLLKKAPVL